MPALTTRCSASAACSAEAQSSISAGHSASLASLKSRGVPDDDPRVMAAREGLAYHRVQRAVAAQCLDDAGPDRGGLREAGRVSGRPDFPVDEDKLRALRPRNGHKPGW